jgi:hypothetical protein
LNHQLYSIEYFKNSLLDSFFSVSEILDDSNHPYHEKVQADLNNFNPSEFRTYIKKYEIDKLLDRFDNKEIERRRFYLIHRIQNQIAFDRLCSLTDNSNRPAPYNNKNLRNLTIDQNGLAEINSFDISLGGFKYNGFVYNLTPITDASNSAYWISQAIIKHHYESKLPFKIRLDPFIEIKEKEYNPMMYKMHVYGKELNWERIKSLQSLEDGKWLNEKSYSDIGNTDFVWYPSQDEVHFTCEELPKSEHLKTRGSRYFHAIFDKKTGKVKHCDGAIRVYDNTEFEKRVLYHVKQSEVRKLGKRIKVFQLDAPINQSVFGSLIVNFFVWNYDVMGYFGAE